MGYVGAVEALTLHNISLHPEHLLRRTKARLHSQDILRRRTLEPELIHCAETVAGAKDDVDRILAPEDLSKPVGKGFFRPVASLPTGVEGAIDVPRPNEQIEIFGVPRDARVEAEGVSAAEQERHLRLPQHFHAAAVKSFASESDSGMR